MPVTNRVVFVFFAFTLAIPGFGQNIALDSTASNGRFSGIALDIFPLINDLFSDDITNDLFTINYLWGKGKQHNEFGLSPVFRNLRTEDDTNEEEETLKSYGVKARLFHGTRKYVAKSWPLSIGMTYEVDFEKNVSKSDDNSSFVFTSTDYALGLGPQLIFGYACNEHLSIRSRIAGLIQFSSSATRIKDGNEEVANQSVEVLQFHISPPTVLELAYTF